MPNDVVHPGGGHPRLHAEAHNLYGLQMARATREGLERLLPDRRPLVISRAGSAGLQRYALHWTGDNASGWEFLWMSMPQLQNLGLSGLAWTGVDVGGFDWDCNGELLTRWTEFGAFQPFCRNHSCRGTRPQEPWAFGPVYESHIRSMLRLRQRLIPYLYTLFEESHRTGPPILRPLLFEFPDDVTTYNTDDEFLLGSSLLVAPIARPGVEYRHVYLPRGTWFDWWNGERFEGPTHILAHAPLGQPPLYLRANAPLPLWPEMSYVGERPADPLTIVLYPALGEGTGTIYEDAGDGYDHLNGLYARTAISCSTSNQQVVVRIDRQEGRFRPARNFVELQLRAFGASPKTVTVDGREVANWTLDGPDLLVRAPAGADSLEFVIRR